MAPELDGFRSRPDGTRYPVHKRKGHGGAAAVAVGTAVALAGGGATGTVGSVGSVGSMGGSAGGTAASSVAESATIRGIQSNTFKAQRTVRDGKPKRAWRQLRLRQTGKKTKRTAECAAFSYGQVRDFLSREPCRDLARAQFTVSDDDGRAMSVLVSRVRMHSYPKANEFRRLIDEHGTGDIRPVFPHVRFTGHHYDSKPSRKTVIVAETEAAHGGVSDELLDAVATAATRLVPR